MNFQQNATNTISNISQKLPESVRENINYVSEKATDVYNSVKTNVVAATDSVKQSINEFSDKVSVDASTEFLQSNTMLAKFAFIILVLIVFIFLVNLGILLIGYFSSPASSPLLVSGTMNGSSELVVSQDPKNKNAIQVQRSNNQMTGIEFTWGVWLIINDIDKKKYSYQNIFNKGDGYYDASGLSTVNNSPGLYLDNTGGNAKLHIMMNTVSNSNPTESIDVVNIPLRKWFHCAIRMKNKVMDVYINGVVSARLVLKDVPKQNYNDVNICKNGGFNGQLADLQYFDRALTVFEMNNIVIWGRNKNPANLSSGGLSASDATGFPYYLSYMWYSSKF
jgi:hypothetical protein